MGRRVSSALLTCKRLLLAARAFLGGEASAWTWDRRPQPRVQLERVGPDMAITQKGVKEEELGGPLASSKASKTS